MRDQFDGSRWEVRMAYQKGWEERLAYYDRLLRSIMELLEGSLKIMKMDELSEEIQSLSKALLEIENAWATLALKKIASLIASGETENQVETDGDME